MTTPEEPSGTSRRDMLKRSALIGGTLLWVTPTVSVLSATPALASSNTPGDGSPLAANWYILLIRCGSSRYLVKVLKDPTGVKPFTLEFGRDKIADRGFTVPKRNLCAHSSFGPPPDVEFFTLGGALGVDLDKDNDGRACQIEFWAVKKGRLLRWKHPLTAHLGPQVIDPDDPYVVQFPIPHY